MAFSFNSAATTNNSKLPEQKFPNNLRPIEIPGAPDDTVSALKFSPKVENDGGNHFMATSWAGDVRLWKLHADGKSEPLSQQKSQQPLLCSTWSSDGKKIYTGCCDGGAYCWDLSNNTYNKVAQHDAPVSCVNIISMNGTDILMTGSWDKTLKFWDLKSSNPVETLNMGYKIHDADACFPVAVIIGSGNTDSSNLIKSDMPNSSNLLKCSVITLNEGKPKILEKDGDNKEWPAKLQHQYSCVSIFKDKDTQQPDGFAVGCTEGRVSLTYFKPSMRKEKDPKYTRTKLFDPNFAFKCHRKDSSVYTIAFVKFHPQFQTLVTSGSDGQYVFWDKDHRTRLGPSPKLDGVDKYEFIHPLTAGDISADGKFFIFATGYDWSYGYDYSNKEYNKPKIYIHPGLVNEKTNEGDSGSLHPKDK